MKSIAILYATREGHTRSVAEHVAGTLIARGFSPEIYDLAVDSDPVTIQRFAGAVLAASVHFGKHEPEMVDFVKAHRAELDAMPCAFLSVNLSEAAAERPGTTERQHAQFAADVERVIARFFEQTGWRPRHTMPVAGALLYTRYNVLVRFVMKQIARSSGGDTDTSRDHVYTDWAALDRFVEQFASQIPVVAAS